MTGPPARRDRSRRRAGRRLLALVGPVLSVWTACLSGHAAEVPPARVLDDFGEPTAWTAVASDGVQASVRLDVGSGGVTATGVRGALAIETGSGSVTVTDVEGELDVDTGSGSVELQGVRGASVLVDTGSGSVRGSEISSPSLHVDTGSGGIRLERVSSPDVALDTGSQKFRYYLVWITQLPKGEERATISVLALLAKQTG